VIFDRELNLNKLVSKAKTDTVSQLDMLTDMSLEFNQNLKLDNFELFD